MIPDPLKKTPHNSSLIFYFYLYILVAIKKLNISLCASNKPRHTFVYIIFVILFIKLFILIYYSSESSDYYIA